MSRPPRFRTRLLVILLAFALAPAVLLTLVWSGTVSTAVPLITGSGGWDRVTTTGRAAIAVARDNRLTSAERRIVDAHENELGSSLEQSLRQRYVTERAAQVIGILALVTLVLFGVIASKVAGHLSRQLSRPLDELVRWAELISHGGSLPETAAGRGAPEFETLRLRMRRMAIEIAEGRRQAVEQERLQTLRESARQFAHELKNPLTPIRFAVDRIAADAPPGMAESLDVLKTETRRLERMARSFADFGRLPSGAAAEIDVGELVRYAASASVPRGFALELDIAPDLPRVRGHHDSLAAALSNILINAVEACSASGRISVRVTEERAAANGAVRISVTDNGCGIPPEKLEAIWEPYITGKPGGTGLGLAIARQTVLASGGRVTGSSTVGDGTTIEITLPVPAPSTAKDELRMNVPG
ncbi:MAG TPA: ATP-binding protein [Gemmatimonadaceae bacterium]|nr:ATP-binding protein [Gemmatimonadaceae bacterium]